MVLVILFMFKYQKNKKPNTIVCFISCHSVISDKDICEKIILDIKMRK